MNTQEMPRVNRRHTIEKVFQVMKVVVNYLKRQKQFKKRSTSKEYLGQTPIYDQAYPQRSRLLHREIRCVSLSLVHFCSLYNRIKSSGKSRQGFWRPSFDIFWPRRHEESSAAVILASKLTALHIAQTVPQFRLYATLWGTLNKQNFG